MKHLQSSPCLRWALGRLKGCPKGQIMIIGDFEGGVEEDEGEDGGRLTLMLVLDQLLR